MYNVVITNVEHVLYIFQYIIPRHILFRIIVCIYIQILELFLQNFIYTYINVGSISNRYPNKLNLQ